MRTKLSFKLPSLLIVNELTEPFGVVRPSFKQKSRPRFASIVSHDGFGPQSELADVDSSEYDPFVSESVNVVTLPEYEAANRVVAEILATSVRTNVAIENIVEDADR